MLQIMVVMVMAVLIPALTYAVQVDFPKVPHRFHKLHSPLIHDEADVDLHPSKIIDDPFDKGHIVTADDKIRAPSSPGLNSRLKHGLEERLRRIHHHNQHRDQKNDKQDNGKERTLKSPKNESKHEQKLLRYHERISEQDHKRKKHPGKGYNQRNTNNHSIETTAHKTPQRNTLLTSSVRTENVADSHHRRTKRDVPGAPLPPNLPLPTHQPPPGMDEKQPWRWVPPPQNFPYINQVPNDSKVRTQTTRMPTTSSTNQSGDGRGSAISHVHGTSRWTLAVASVMSHAISSLAIISLVLS